MSLLLDAGALIALEKRNRLIGATLELARRERIPVRTSAGVVAQVWRGGPRQANLARVLGGVQTIAVTLDAAKQVGVLLGTGPRDVIDAHVALLAHDGDYLLTSDPADLRRLLKRRGVTARIVAV